MFVAMAIALAFEGVCDVISMTVQSYQGVPMLDVLSGKKSTENILNLVFLQGLASSFIFCCFLTRPTLWGCPEYDLCSCNFIDRSEILGDFCCGSEFTVK